jgi:hypothetical protein
MFGLLGVGILGNDASFEVVLNQTWERCPDAVFDALCSVRQELTARHGIESTPSLWYQEVCGAHVGDALGRYQAAGKVVEVIEMLRRVCRHDVVIVPGTFRVHHGGPVAPHLREGVRRHARSAE